MAKRKSGAPNKSQAIRDYKKSHPRTKPKQISEALRNEGIEVSPGFVSTILSASKKKKVRKPGRPKASKSAKRVGAAEKAGMHSEVSFDSLLKVKAIVEEVGGVDKARIALDALERLMH